MSSNPFVPQTGTKQDDRGTRQLIRRHVMLGKNQGRTRRPQQTPIKGARVFSKDDWESPNQPVQSVLPRRVGTDLSFLEFADTVEFPLMSDTIRFCFASHEMLFILEPCISFNLTDIEAGCVKVLAYDALYLNIAVWGAQAYMDQSVRQSTSNQRRSSRKASLQHYGKALALLRERLAGACSQCSISGDTTIMSVSSLAMNALVIGDFESAKNHVFGLRMLVSMRENGIHSFRSNLREMIDLLRCDISHSLATGQMPAFFSESSHEMVFPLPELTGVGKSTQRRISIINSELAKIWNVLRSFCEKINAAAVEGDKVSEQVLLETMASIMYRLFDKSIRPGSTDYAIRLAMLSFCASTLLPWRHVRIPLVWLQSETKRSVTRLMQSDLPRVEPRVTLWVLSAYGVAFLPLSADEHKDLQVWLMEVTHTCGIASWDSVKTIVDDFLWIDIVCDPPAQRLFDQTFAGQCAPTNVRLSNDPAPGQSRVHLSTNDEGRKAVSRQSADQIPQERKPCLRIAVEWYEAIVEQSNVALKECK